MLKKPSMLTRPRAFFVQHPGAIAWGSVGFTLVMLGMVLAILIQGHHDAAARAIENAQNLERVLEHDIAHTAELTDLSIQAVVDGVQSTEIMALPERYRQEILFDRSATAGRDISVMLYLDAAGKIVENSTTAPRSNVNLADREWFTVHRSDARRGLYISRPLQSRLNNGEVNVMFSRRVNHPGGEFAGVVVAALRLDYFKSLLNGVDPGPGGTITLVQTDGNVIVRYPFASTAAGAGDLNGRKNFERFRKTNEAAFFATSGVDGEARLYVFRKIPQLNMVIIVAPSRRYVFADWTERAWYLGILSLMLSVGLLATARFLSLEFRHRLKVESELRMMTGVDGLTGLSNRRNLDECLMLEWRRALRSGKPLALLFVDIDWFKHYNDTYGHQAGDDALTAVAQAIARSTRRPSDIAARFGGEEFVVVLPETDADGASAIAAAIHLAVRLLAVEHVGSQFGVVTVSIGLACTDGNAVADPLALMKLADEAVYRAKAAGRNQTAIAAPLPENVMV